jgi:Type ISP C-terminal specificity domain/N-6 DNA Methylase
MDRHQGSADRLRTLTPMSRPTDELREALAVFAETVRAKFQALARGEPEDQIRGPFETLLETAGRAVGHQVIAKGESLLEGGLGKPDYAVVVDDALSGYAELKAPGVGVVPSRLKGHDRKQFKRFGALPNLLYCDGNSFALYHDGERIQNVISVFDDITSDAEQFISNRTVEDLYVLLSQFFAWEPIVPRSAKQLAEILAPLCRLLRDATTEAVGRSGSSLAHLKGDWQNLLFPDADDEQFADAYAQTVTYSLLLARAEGATDLDAASAANTLQASEHLLLARALQVLTDPTVRMEIGSLLSLLERTIAAVDPRSLTSSSEKDPWLYFYETFLAAYDPALRRNAGVYYTPVPVVQTQVRLADEILRSHLGKSQGFADQNVLTLDPALGTGTYLIGVIQHALDAVMQSQGPGARPGKATALARSLHGFEVMVGPYAVAQLRVTRELKDNSANLPKEGAKIYLTDTLEHPSAAAPQPALFLEPIAIEHARAQEVKDKTPILVCIGNPPYDRHDAEADLGGWVRYGGEGEEAPLADFIEPVRNAGQGTHLKNLYNLYVYFWRWAIWKVFEHGEPGPGIVSFISASSYLAGPGFLGMREKMRRECDDIWVIDLGGEGRGTRQEENVFEIQTPVAIAIAVRREHPQRETPANVHYSRISGSREEKLAALAEISSLADLVWQECPAGWQDPFRPKGVGDYFQWPALSDLFPWRHSGVQVKRLWPIGVDAETLDRRWRDLFESNNPAVVFRETRDRHFNRLYGPQGQLGSGPRLSDLYAEAREGKGLPEPKPAVAYSYRSFDRQYLIADNRLIDFGRPPLWNTASEDQIYLTTLMSHPLGAGPALTIAAHPPDLHHFRGSYGGADVFPLWRDQEATIPNLHPDLIALMEQRLGFRPTPEQVAGYVVAVLAHPGYSAVFDAELEVPGPRVPLTADPELFAAGAELGEDLVWTATYGERFGGPDRPQQEVVGGIARNTHDVSQEHEKYPEGVVYDRENQELRVGNGVFAPVAPQIWEYSVSGLRVVDSWLENRLRERSGKTRSPLDQIQPERWTPSLTEELLELLWTLEAVISFEPGQGDLLERILEGDLIQVSDLRVLHPDDLVRKPPEPSQQTLL